MRRSAPTEHVALSGAARTPTYPPGAAGASRPGWILDETACRRRRAAPGEARG